MTPLLKIKGLSTQIQTATGAFLGVNNISLSMESGQMIGLLGESGCGKSLTALSILGLIEAPHKIIGGDIELHGSSLLNSSEKQWRSIRGKKIAYVPQDSNQALNPYLTLGFQISEQIHCHENLKSKEIKKRSLELLTKVGFPEAEFYYHQYPHQLSGGMKQRALIAMALSCQPHLVIADEPTSSLDSILQSQILALFHREQQERHLGVLLISHDIGFLKNVCSEIYVMYGGRICEWGPTRQILETPSHPYTRGLIRSEPQLGDTRERLPTIEGSVPPPVEWAPGCPFRNRCSRVLPSCHKDFPAAEIVQKDSESPIEPHRVACYNPYKGEM